MWGLVRMQGALYLRESSRLSCQIEVTQQLDGLVLHLPPPQF
jgi:ferredoxin